MPHNSAKSTAKKTLTSECPGGQVAEHPIADLPLGWHRTRLGDVCDIVAKQVDPKFPEFSGLPHVNGENIESGTSRLFGVRSAAEDGMMSNKYLFEPGDVLYSKIRPYLRKAVVVGFRGLCSADVYPIRVKPDRLDPYFLGWLLLSDAFTRFADAESRRARMPKLNREQLFSWSFLLPPVAEQERIVSRVQSQLAEVARARVAVQMQLVAAEALPTVLLDKVFDSSETTEWSECRLGDVLLRIDAGKCVNCEERQAQPLEWGVLKVSAVTWSEFRPEENKVLPQGFIVPDGAEVCPGDFLISRSNTTTLVGAVVLVRQTRPRLMLSDKTLRLVPRTDAVSSEFLEFLLRSPRCRRFIEESAGGASSSMKNITQDAIRNIPIVLPQLEQQRRIARRLADGFAATRLLRSELTARSCALGRLPAAILSEGLRLS